MSIKLKLENAEPGSFRPYHHGKKAYGCTFHSHHYNLEFVLSRSHNFLKTVSFFIFCSIVLCLAGVYKVLLKFLLLCQLAKSHTFYITRPRPAESSELNSEKKNYV